VGICLYVCNKHEKLKAYYQYERRTIVVKDPINFIQAFPIGWPK
jgi:hypothetical protein